MQKPLCIVAGVGAGNGMSICKRFLEGGYRVAILARDESALKEYAQQHDEIYPFPCDLANPDAIKTIFSQISDQLGVPQTVAYNAGSGVFGPPLETKQEDFEQAWRVNALGLLIVSQTVAPAMISKGGGNLIITGATASLRGGAHFAAFSSAKAAQRNLAQSLARSLGPQGIHVALVIVDGVVDMPRTREMFPDKADNFFLKPAAIAENIYQLTLQDKTAWTFELDLRPSEETW